MGRADRAKIFWSGRSQLVLLPEEYCFHGTEVTIRRHGDAVILEPIPRDWRWLDELVERGLDDDFIEAVEERPEPQERTRLDNLSD